MSLYRPAPPSEEPECTLVRWSVMEVTASWGVTRHMVGMDVATGEGRVSSPIESWDGETRLAITQSGRVYKLDGPPGFNRDAEYVRGVWLRRSGIAGERVTDATDEYWTDADDRANDRADGAALK